MPKPAAINAGTLLATKGNAHAAPGTVQRGQTPTEKLVDLNFKVPAEFRDEFKQLAWDVGRIKNVQLLQRAIEAYKREQGRG
jgi:hypothetical protein